MMKFMNLTPDNKTNKKRTHLLKTLISCVVIAAILISLSVSLSYARYNSYVAVPDIINFRGNDFVHAGNVVISYINREDNTAPTVLKYHGDDIVVTVPRGLSAEEDCIAYALTVNELKDVAYNVKTGTYQESVKLSLVGLLHPDGDTLRTAPVVTTSDKMLNLRLNAPGVETIVDNNDNGHAVVHSSDGYVEYDQISLSDNDSDFELTLDYHKRNWNDVADTSWYHSDSSVASYDLETPSQLAGLAKLVNDGVDFSGVTINLTDDVSFYGNGIDGDIREWVPIGTEDHPFRGNFNGGGYALTGLTLSGGINASYIGLFGVVDGTADSFIKDFNLVYPTVYGKANAYTGSVVGKATGYHVDNVNITSLTISAADNAKVGTVAGYVDTIFSFNGNVDSSSADFEEIGYRSTSETASTEAPSEAAAVAETVAATVVESPTEGPTE